MSTKYDIDNYLNPFIPLNPLHHLPNPISHFLGHRPRPTTTKKPPRPPHILIIYLFSFLGAFIGVAAISLIYLHLPPFSSHPVPIIIASFGAAAILEYNTIDSPLAQPRNLVLGHLLSAVLGVGVTKLFLLLPPSRFEELRWLAGALAVGSASVAMSMTKTVHPPAGATALLAATSKEVTDLGWWLIVLVALGCGIMLTSACVVNNVVRRFPVYWWTPVDLVELRKAKSAARRGGGGGGGGGVEDVERGFGDVKSDEGEVAGAHADAQRRRLETSESGVSGGTSVGSDTLRGSTDLVKVRTNESRAGMTGDSEHLEHQAAIFVSKGSLSIPPWLHLNESDKNVLALLQKRLADGESPNGRESSN